MKLPVQSARLLRWFHLVATLGWTVMIPISVATGLKHSLPFLVGISVYALAGSHFASYQGARAEDQASSSENGGGDSVSPVAGIDNDPFG